MGRNVSIGWITCSVGGDASIVCVKMYYTTFEKDASIGLHFCSVISSMSLYNVGKIVPSRGSFATMYSVRAQNYHEDHHDYNS
jgi:hypothetical protein